MTTITWQIAQVDCVPQENAHTNVVRTVHWRVLATEDNYNASIPGITTLNPPTDGFVEFDNLTEAQIVTWIKNTLGTEQVTALEDSLTRMIENQKNPPIVTPQLPWVPVLPVV